MIKNITLSLLASLLITTAYAENKDTNKNKVVKKKVADVVAEDSDTTGSSVGPTSRRTTPTERGDGMPFPLVDGISSPPFTVDLSPPAERSESPTALESTKEKEKAVPSSALESLQAQKAELETLAQQKSTEVSSAESAVKEIEKGISRGGRINPINWLYSDTARAEEAQTMVDINSFSSGQVKELQSHVGAVQAVIDSEKAVRLTLTGDHETAHKLLSETYKELNDIALDIEGRVKAWKGKDGEIKTLAETLAAQKKAARESQRTFNPKSWSWFGANGQNAKIKEAEAALLKLKKESQEIIAEVANLLKILETGKKALEADLEVQKAEKELNEAKEKKDNRWWISRAFSSPAETKLAETKLRNAQEAQKKSQEVDTFERAKLERLLANMEKEEVTRKEVRAADIKKKSEELSALAASNEAEITRLREALTTKTQQITALRKELNSLSQRLAAEQKKKEEEINKLRSELN